MLLKLNPVLFYLLQCESAGPHKIQGIGAGFIPGNLDQDVMDEVIEVLFLSIPLKLLISSSLFVKIENYEGFHVSYIVVSKI